MSHRYNLRERQRICAQSSRYSIPETDSSEPSSLRSRPVRRHSEHFRDYSEYSLGEDSDCSASHNSQAYSESECTDTSGANSLSRTYAPCSPHVATYEVSVVQAAAHENVVESTVSFTPLDRTVRIFHQVWYHIILKRTDYVAPSPP